MDESKASCVVAVAKAFGAKMTEWHNAHETLFVAQTIQRFKPALNYC